ncbi:hypothetical protein MchiMG62_13230 [Methanoculleus chikugoensis]|uniref:ATP-dependent DNA helicase RecG C-terminal domain-containing protein n=1 Tax=Methanoculleus chikugoensis TaxID=118126 RepID=A0ABM7H5S9_9EURY|nr:hypothetical protein MchiMG62_13230 [Methanoculleus chikugoensis]
MTGAGSSRGRSGSFCGGTNWRERSRGRYEIPEEAVAEAIVNAVAHHGRTSNGSVQVMLFSDRLAISGAVP